MTLRNLNTQIHQLLKTYHSQLRFIISATIICIGLATISEFIVFNKVIPHQSSYYFAWSRFVSVAIIALVATLLVKFRHYFLEHLEYAFLMIAIPMGTLFIFVLPKTVYVSQDDQIHLQRAATLLSASDVSWSKAFRTLELMSTSVENMSFAEMDTVYDQFNSIHEDTKDQSANFGDNSLSFSQLVYLPYFIGFKVSALLHLKFTSMIVVAKLCNLMCYILILFFAIKVSTHAKKIFFVLALFLSNIFYASQFSYDPTITASIMLAIALFLRMLEMPHIPTRYFIAFVLAVTWASLPKAIYCPILLLVFFVPSQKFGNHRRAIACKTSAVSLMVLLALTFVLPIISGGMMGDFRGGNTSVAQQILHILHNPLHFIYTFGKFTVYELPGLMLSQPTSVGIYLPFKYTSYVLPIINLMYIILLGYAIFTSRKPFNIYTPLIRVVIFMVYFITVYSAIGALYLSFTPVGSSRIEGFQDRYLLPVLPLALILLVPTAKSITKPHEAKPNFALLAVPFLSLALFLGCFILRVSIF